MTDDRILLVNLGGVRVGELRFRNEAVTFRTSEFYAQMADRPVLGQIFEDDLAKQYHVSVGVPAWFSNLLPEGPLRELIARKLDVHPSRDFFLLAHLGRDLPGAVEVLPAPGWQSWRASDEETEAGDADAQENSDHGFRFSLAGVQLKFSVLQDDRGVTLPVAGDFGNYIAKLPDRRFGGVPENEFSMMSLAREAGVSVPDFSLVDVGEIQGLPEELVEPGRKAFLIHRFDRTSAGRVHIEDFAQVLNRFPTPKGKYSGANYETIGRILMALGGERDLREFVRRLVVMTAIGNGDAHLKNWSLIYPNGQVAELSPAYDLVSTVTYARTAESLALNLAGSKSFEDITLKSFRRLARKVELPSETDLDETIRSVVGEFRDAWTRLRADLPMTVDVREVIEQRLSDLPLMQE